MAKQYARTTEIQRKTRHERKFADIEHDLPNFQHTFDPHNPKISMQSLPDMKKPGALKEFGWSKATDILSYFGNKNPLPQQVTKDDTVWLLDNTAFKDPKTGNWNAEFVAAVFAKEPSCSVVDAVHAVASKVELSSDDPKFDSLGERILPFLQDIKPGRQVNAVAAGKEKVKLGPGGRNGISSDIKPVPSSSAGVVAKSFVEVPQGANGLLEAKTFYAEPEGWAVISDVDDTIKITQTSDPIGILRSTFVDEPTPIAGMPELYTKIHALLTPAAPWFYLSASPYNLYPFLRSFRERHFPHGTIILRDSSWMSIPGLLSNLTLGTEQYKVDRIKKINSWLPKKKLILIGDSTQSDPEAYGDIARDHPEWVKVILIRKVTDIAAVGIESKNEPKRFEEAFEKIPREVWHVFEDPAECYNIIQKVVAAQP